MEGYRFWRRGNGGSSSPTNKREQYTPLFGDTDVVSWPGTAPTLGPHSLHPSLPLSSQGVRHLLAVVSIIPTLEALLGLTLDHMSSPWTHGLGLHTQFVAMPCLRLTHTHLYTSAMLPERERHGFILDRTTQVSLGGDQAPLLPFKGRPIV
jgi:hypothetical protein